MKELNRICNDVTIRFDKIYDLAMWLTSDRESIVVANTLALFPRPIRWVIRLVRFPIDRRSFPEHVRTTFPVLRKLGLLDKWNYYEIG
jgi:hypothetical protein